MTEKRIKKRNPARRRKSKIPEQEFDNYIVGEIKNSPINGFTIIVTGYPRSGTSMMMQALHKGGIPVIVHKDKISPVSEFNPYGDWEVANVGPYLKRTDPKYTERCAVKLVAPFLHYLPMDRKCKVIFMMRDEQEIITSLLAMRTVWDHLPNEAVTLARRFLDENDIQYHTVWYKEVLKFPKSTLMGISDFLLSDGFDVDSASEAIDPDARTRVSNIHYKAHEEPLLGFDFKLAEITQINTE